MEKKKFLKVKVLITGGMGYLGGRLAQFLASQPGYEVLLGSRRLTDSPHWLPQAKVVQTPWNSPDGLRKICSGVDAIVHLAGMGVHECAADPVKAVEVNGIETLKLLQAAEYAGVERFLYFSTAHVYGSPLSGVITESTLPRPLHPYAISHRLAEDFVLASHQQEKITGLVVRLSNGLGVPADPKINQWTLITNDLCRQCVTEDKLTLKSTGVQQRDFIPMIDVCRAAKHLLIMNKENVGNGLFNLGGQKPLTILQLAELIQQRCNHVLGFVPPIEKPESNEDASQQGSLDYHIDKLLETGFVLRGSLEEEIDKTLWFTDRHFGQKGKSEAILR